LRRQGKQDNGREQEMSKQITLGIVVVALLISAGNLSARDADNQPGQRPRFMGGGLLRKSCCKN
jgi:hypothetical protein